MPLKRLRYGFFGWLLLLAILAAAGGYFFFSRQHVYLLVIVPAVLFLAFRLSTIRLQVYTELQDFCEAVKYHDFTRSYPIRTANPETAFLRDAFNGINSVFKEISGEKEIQYQYLQSLLDITDTGIISYDTDTDRVIWTNESFRKLFGIPYLHSFEALKRKNQDVYTKTLQTKPGTATLLTVQSPNGPLKLILNVRDFRTAGGHFRMISYQNVNEAIDKTESQAWQKLLSVLTHEIMNSIAPISSLAGTLAGRLQQLGAGPGTEDIRLGVDTIRRRSDGLLKFAQTYRSLNNVTKLNLREVKISGLFENLYQLFEPTLIQKGIEMDIIMKDPGLRYELDGGLIEQVLINLTLNAIDAVKDSAAPYISLTALIADNRLQIKIADNGKGIPADLLENIFIPFFTTRKTGSGVGLTLGKKIMLLHGGNIRVESTENMGSTFTLAF
ncbi:MAG: histidine kinase [Cytophagaceae bacterium SCN 52-12]|nr:MAG: histidine kinase [Cytophagaceae bacterium SCN 52-12]